MAENNNPPTTPGRGSKLDYETLTLVGDVIAGLLDREFDRILSDKTQNEIISFLYDFYYQERLYSLFILKNLSEITERIMTNVEVRDFVMNLTDHYSFYLSTNEEISNRLINTIAEGICRNKIPYDQNGTSFSLLGSQFNQSIYVGQEPLVSLLRNNFWLVTLVMVYMTMPRTKFFTNNLTQPPITTNVAST